jgi:hypothetical protein
MGIFSFYGKSVAIYRPAHENCHQRHGNAVAPMSALFSGVIGDQVEPEIFHEGRRLHLYFYFA